MNIASLLRAQPADLAAIVEGGQVMTFAELDRAAARAAELLHRHGLRAGQRVLVFYPMSCQLYVALLALFRLGLTAMFLDPSAGRGHIERCCALCPPDGLIASPKAHLLRLVSPALRRIPRKFVIGWPVPGAVRWSAAGRLPPRVDLFQVERDTPALLTFTSGSTGQPRAAVRTHGFLLAQHRALEQNLDLKAGTIDLTTLPIVLLANLASGVTSVIPAADLRYPGSVRPGPVLRQLAERRIETSAGSPAFYECLARAALASAITLPALKKVFLGGAPVFPRLLDQLAEVAPRAELVSVYGSTEAEPIAHVSRHELGPDDRRAMTAGRGLLAGSPVAQIALRIIPDRWGQPLGPYTEEEFGAQAQPPSRPGEIVVQGAHVLTGYLHGQGDQETKFRVGAAIWHRTGDAGYLDGQGRLWLLGRCAARIDDARGELYPFSAECAAYLEPGVRRAAAVAHRGRRLLVVEWFPRTPADPASLKQRLGWAQFDEVLSLTCLPVDGRHNAKIDYPRLQRMLDRMV